MRASQQLIKKLIAPLLLISTSVFSLQANAVELTPLYGYRAGGEFIDDLSGQKHTIRSSDIYGLIVGFPYDYKRDFEIYYSHQSSELTSISVDTPAAGSSTTIPLTVDYLHFGGTARDLLAMPWYHPTLSEVLLGLARDLDAQRG